MKDSKDSQNNPLLVASKNNISYSKLGYSNTLAKDEPGHGSNF